MKKVKNLILALLIICSPVLLSAMKSDNPEKSQVTSLVKKPLYSYYSAYYELTMDYNPANGRITGFAFDPSTGKVVSNFDVTGGTVTYDHASQTVTLTNIQIYIQGQGWMAIGDAFVRI